MLYLGGTMWRELRLLFVLMRTVQVAGFQGMFRNSFPLVMATVHRSKMSVPDSFPTLRMTIWCDSENVRTDNTLTALLD